MPRLDAKSMLRRVRVGALMGAFAVLMPGLVQAAQSPAPLALDPTDGWSTVMTVHWDPNGNPDGMLYQLQVSESPGFGSTKLNLITGSTSWVLTGLQPGGTYYMHVLANYASPDASPYTTLPSTTTNAASPPGPAPVNPVISSVTSNSITVMWESGPSSGYVIEASTVADFSGSVFSQTPFSLTTTISGLGLTSSTTYFVRVGARYHPNGGSTSLFNYAPTTPASVVTDPSTEITSLMAYQVGSTTITWAWNLIPAATSYNVYMATSPSTLIATVDTNRFDETGLSINRLYGRVVSGIVDGVEGPLSPATSSYTLAATPGGPVYPNVGHSSATLTWDANGNSNGTVYELQRSVNNFSSWQDVSSSTPTYTFTNLVGGSTYYFRTRVQNSAAQWTPYSPVTSVRTLGNIIPRNFAASDVGVSSITWTWDQDDPVDHFFVFQSTSGTFVRTTLSPGYTETGLTPNTSYSRYVIAYGYDAVSDPSTSATAYTLAAVPGTPVLNPVYYTSATVTWAAQGNPGSTRYELSQSTASDFSVLMASIPFSANLTGTTTSFFNLTSGTTYYYRVRAQNADLLATNFSGTSSLTTQTAVPAGLTASNVGLSSITWTWTLLGPATSYNLYVASSPTTRIASNILTNTYVENNLSTNTAYGRIVTAYIGGAETLPSASTTIYTLAGAPTSASPTGILATQVTAHWNANGNPVGTSYLVQASANAGFSAIDAFANSTSLSAVLTGLQAETTYFTRVRASNADGVPTGFTSLPSAITLPNPPAAPTLSATALSISTIAWSWNLVSGATAYQVVASTGGNLSEILSAGTTIFTQSGLLTNTLYSDRVVAFNAGGASSSTVLTRYTLALPPTGSVLSNVGVSSITLSWDDLGNPGATSYQAQLWRAGGTTTTIRGAGTNAVFSDLSPETTYFLNVATLNGDDLATPADVTLSTMTFPTESTVAHLDSGNEQTVIFQSENGPVVITIPANSFPDNVVMNVQAPENYPAAASNAGNFRVTNVGVEITLDQNVQPTKHVLLTIPFSNLDVAGLEKDTLILARYDPEQNTWVPYVSRVDTENNTVSAEVNHFSIYQIMSVAAPPVLNAVKIFPNPFRPVLGHTAITISNLPANSRIRVYTIAGELVKDLSANATGMVSWDATNHSGQKVASGLYFVFVQGAGDKKRLRVVIQR